MTKINLEFKRKSDSVAEEKKGVIVAKKKTTTFKLFENLRAPLKHFLIDKEVSFSDFAEKFIVQNTKNNKDIKKIHEFWEKEKGANEFFVKNIRLDPDKMKLFYHFLETNNLKPMHFFNYYLTKAINNSDYDTN